MNSQTDAAYFTTPTGTASRVLPRRPKSTSATVPTVPTVPLDLAKPRDLVASINRGPSVELPPLQTHKQTNGVKQNDQFARDIHQGVTDRQDPPTGHKRPATEHNLQLPGHASTSNGGKARAHPPPAKRPKKEKASIFMPKKPNKVRLVP